MAFKMKNFSGFGNSPMKQKGFIRTPLDFDHVKAKANAKKQFNIHGAKSGHGTIKDLYKKNFDKFQTQKTTAKEFVKKLKPQIKKGIKPISTLSKVLRGSGIGLGLEYLYRAYKSGQKHSGGKIDPNQKSIMKEGKKKIDKSKFNVSIFKMKGFSGFGNTPVKKIKIKNIFKRNKNKKTPDEIAREEYEKQRENLKNISKRASETVVEGLAEGTGSSFIGKSKTLNPKNKTKQDKAERPAERKPVRNKIIKPILPF